MIYIYTEHKSVRLNYITGHIFGSILGVDYTLTDDRDFFLLQTGVCINYSVFNIGKGIWMIPADILFETGIHPMNNYSPSMWGDLFCFFFNEVGDIPFDLFAASFYLLTRYEEYFSVSLDEHLRYNPHESMAVKNDFLEVPLVDRWAYKLMEILKKQEYGNSTVFRLRSYQAINTFDIDHPYLYRNKGLIKNIFGLCRDLLKQNVAACVERIKTIFHFQEDSYFDAVCRIDDFQKSIGEKYYLFVFVGSYGKFGRTTIYPQRMYYRYIKKLTNAKIGLHASYHTFLNRDNIFIEKKKLEQKLHKRINRNRQHFLQMQIPVTFRLLNELGFTEDFTLGYSTMPGFRASTAVPFFFYDLQKDAISTLLIRPTIVMDATLIRHLKLTPEEAIQKIKTFADACRSSGGDFLMLWHNSTLSGTTEKNPWIKVFLESSKYAFS